MGSKRNLLAAILYLALAIACIFGIFIKSELESYMITGTVIFSILGIAYIKKYLGRKY